MFRTHLRNGDQQPQTENQKPGTALLEIKPIYIALIEDKRCAQPDLVVLHLNLPEPTG